MLEIVQLENGDIVLRRAGKPEEELLTIQFSDSLEQQLQGLKLDIAKAMIQAGVNTYADIIESGQADISEDEDKNTPEPPTIH